MIKLSKEKIAYLKSEYPVGTRVMCDDMQDKYQPVPSGTIGSVVIVDDAGTIHVDWDNGSGLGLVYGVDSFHKVLG